MQLEAPSLYALIESWADTKLQISEDEARIIGCGYPKLITEAFTSLVFDWEATTFLLRETLPLAEGTYELVLKDGLLLACKDPETCVIKDQPVQVEVLPVPQH
jgi:hypothetical protein